MQEKQGICYEHKVTLGYKVYEHKLVTHNFTILTGHKLINLVKGNGQGMKKCNVHRQQSLDIVLHCNEKNWPVLLFMFLPSFRPDRVICLTLCKSRLVVTTEVD